MSRRPDAPPPQHLPSPPEAADALRHRAERLVQAVRIPGQSIPEDPSALIHELQVHQIELELQNEELLRARDELELSRERFRDLFESAPVGYLLLDPSGRMQQVNQTAAALLGRGAGDLQGTQLARFCNPADQDRLHYHLRDARRAPGPHVCELGFTRPDGDARTLRLQSVRETAEEGVRGTLRSALHDVTAEQRAREQLRLAASVFDNTPEGILVTDADQRIVSVNRSFTETTGYSPEEALGRTPAMLRSGVQDSAFYRAMWRSLEQTGRWQGEIWNRRKNGEVYPEWLNINVIRDDAGQVTHYAAIFSDITHQEHVKRRLHRLAYYDALTGLPNRQLFQDRLSTAIHAAHRKGGRVALLFMDLDRFKNVNDSLGHSLGDRLLSFIAGRLTACVRESDTVARLGGDEFTLVLAEPQRPDDAARVADKILQDLAVTPFSHEGHEIFVGASIGIALYPDDGRDTETLIQAADIAMYRAKDGGRNGYRFYAADMSARFSDRLALETDLRRAIDRGELALVYQPQVDLDSGRVVGCEALARWSHPSRGQVPPGLFVPLAEETGLILPLGDWVLDTAIAQTRALRQAGFSDLRVAVNVSGAQLRPPHMERLLERIQAADCGADCPLELELTESVLMAHADDIVGTLERIKALGVGLAVDDFGTGYSSLAYLKRFPIDRLKIAQSFVRDIPADRNDAVIAATVIAMGQKLGLGVIAEGVETPEQLAFLRENGCGEAQGFLFSEPLSAEALGALLAAGGAQAPPGTPE